MDQPARTRALELALTVIGGSFYLKIASLGTGGVGAALGSRWGAAGHLVTYGSRAPQSEKVQQIVAKSGAAAAAKSPGDAIVGADAILFAVPWPVARQTLETLGDLSGR